MIRYSTWCCLASLLVCCSKEVVKKNPATLCTPGDIKQNVILNPSFVREAACSHPVAIASEACFTGWHNANGLPTVLEDNTLALSGSLCGRFNAAVRATLAAPLTPGQTYRLSFAYRLPPRSNHRQRTEHRDRETPAYGGDIETYYMQLSRETPFAKSDNCSKDAPLYPDYVVRDGSAPARDTAVWKLELSNVDVPDGIWKIVNVTFVPESDSRYLFIMLHHDGILAYPTAIHIRDLAIGEICML